MAAWFTALRAVPWKQVLAAAPTVADGARTLWQAVGRRRAPDVPDAAAPAEPAASPEAAEAPALAELRRADAARAEELATLRAQLAESTKLIAELAEQNTQLVLRVQQGRKALQVLAAVAGAGVLLAVTALVVAWPG